MNIVQIQPFDIGTIDKGAINPSKICIMLHLDTSESLALNSCVRNNMRNYGNNDNRIRNIARDCLNAIVWLIGMSELDRTARNLEKHMFQEFNVPKEHKKKVNTIAKDILEFLFIQQQAEEDIILKNAVNL